MANVKKLNEVSLNKGFSKFNEKVTERVTDRFGEEYEVEFSKYLKKTDTQKIMIDYMNIIEELEGMEGIDNLKDSIILPMLMIKYFTNIPIQDEGEKLLIMADKLIELELFNSILDLLPENELLNMGNIAEQFKKSVEFMVAEKEKEKESSNNEE